MVIKGNFELLGKKTTEICQKLSGLEILKKIERWNLDSEGLNFLGWKHQLCHLKKDIYTKQQIKFLNIIL